MRRLVRQGGPKEVVRSIKAIEGRGFPESTTAVETTTVAATKDSSACLLRLMKILWIKWSGTVIADARYVARPSRLASAMPRNLRQPQTGLALIDHCQP